MFAQTSARSHGGNAGAGSALLPPPSRNKSAAFAVRLLILACALVGPSSSRADPVKAEVSVDVSGGYARLVFTMRDDVDASVQTAGDVLIVRFSQPLAVNVDRLATRAPDYIGVARRDPDGLAVRIGLARHVTVNSINAADRFFVDLLPDTWKGPPPSLPQEVIEELARKAREAERLERREHAGTSENKAAPVRVHVATLPTFMRFSFDVPAQTGVSADRGKNELTLTFDAPIVFDLTDAEAALPQALAVISTQVGDKATVVRFGFLGTVDARTFRDGGAYVVDIAAVGAQPAGDGRGAGIRPPQMALGGGDSADAVSPADAARAVEAAAAAMLGKSDAAPVERQSPPGPAAAPSARAPADTQQDVTPPAKSAAAAAPAKPAGTERPAASTAAGAKPAAAAPRSDAQAATPAPQGKPDADVKAAAPRSDTQAATPAPQGKPDADVKAAAPRSDAQAATPAPQGKPDADMKAAAPRSDAQAATPAPQGKPDADVKAAAPRSADAALPASTDPKGRDPVRVSLSSQGADLKLSFPFVTPTAAAVFMRADTLWIVFDSKSAIDLSGLEGEPSRTIRDAQFVHAGDADVVRLRLDHPHLPSVAADGAAWIVSIGDVMLSPTRALDVARDMMGQGRASIAIAFSEPHQLHRLHDGEVGDDLLVITGFPPARGFIEERDFVEFRALASTQGVAIEPIADDLSVKLAADKIVVGRPAGLTLSSSLRSVSRGDGLRPALFDSRLWDFNRQVNYVERQEHLITAAAEAPASERMASRLDLARFYIARDMYPEAKGVLDAALADNHRAADVVSASVLRALAEVMMNRPEEALKDLASPMVGDQQDAPLWRALAYACQGKWGMARDNFKTIEPAIATLPPELQRVALKDEMRAAIEVGDYAGAADQLNNLQTVGLTRELQPAVSVLIGRLSEGVGHSEDALTAYRTAADSWDRQAAAQARLREIALQYALGDLKRSEVISQLETLTTVWRGDETETEALHILARLYIEEGRYRDAFYVMRAAVAAHPNSDITRRIQADAAAAFDALFLSGQGDSLPPIEALSLFYDFRELTPIGRRGDEMIRRLADRLVSVDLLDQAASLLQYQVDHRLEGAARAQVATRLAVIYLMDRKPDRALATLRATRSADLATELRNQRLLLEARALSDLGRHALALDVIANIPGREAIRLRSDILWAARRWAESAEQIELYYGDRWKQWQPLNEIERADILRAAVGYALAEDKLGAGRLREKYAPKMAQTPDARAFEVVSTALDTSGKEFRAIAQAAAAVDTLEGFLRDMQARYPDSGARSPPQAAPPAPGTPVSTAAPPAARPAEPAPLLPPPRAAGRSAQR
jgi:tetratricopeptide (TPR) repeat protein